MKKRYLPFGYQITDGKTTIVQEEAEAVQHIFEEYSREVPSKNCGEHDNEENAVP